jgi:hypothetical protein
MAGFMPGSGQISLRQIQAVWTYTGIHTGSYNLFAYRGTTYFYHADSTPKTFPSNPISMFNFYAAGYTSDTGGGGGK